MRRASLVFHVESVGAALIHPLLRGPLVASDLPPPVGMTTSAYLPSAVWIMSPVSREEV